jgi:hypothetical protein
MLHDEHLYFTLVPSSFVTHLQSRGCPLPGVFGFLDGTCIRVCRPVYGDDVLYNGRYKFGSLNQIFYFSFFYIHFLIRVWLIYVF